MPTFDTPTPIAATIELAMGNVRLVAEDRADTVVEVRPRNAAKQADVRAAEQLDIDYADGRLTIKQPRQANFLSRTGAVELTVALPTGSHLRGGAALGAFRAEGRLGDCQLKTASGDVRLDTVAGLDLNTGSGDVIIDHATGDVRVTVGSGTLRVGRVDGSGHLRNASGDSWIGWISGDVRLSAASGSITVDEAGAGVRAKTASGAIRVNAVTRGTVELQTASGDLEIGIREGTAAWVDVSAMAGSVRNGLAGTDGPTGGEEQVQVRARALSGDVVIRRA